MDSPLHLRRLLKALLAPTLPRTTITDFNPPTINCTGRRICRLLTHLPPLRTIHFILVEGDRTAAEVEDKTVAYSNGLQTLYSRVPSAGKQTSES